MNKHVGVVLVLFQSISDYCEAADLITVFITVTAFARLYIFIKHSTQVFVG